MKKTILLIFSIFPLVALSQNVKTYEYQRFRLGIEAGTGFLSGRTVKPDAIRENRSYYYEGYYYHDDYYCGYVYNDQTTPYYYVGIKPEFSIAHRFSIAAGLRLLGSIHTFNSDRGYFLWNVSEKDLTTQYVRVKDVTQNNFYVGTPIEMTVYPSKGDLFVRHYLKAGVVLNFLLVSATTPHFESATMNKYAKKVKNDVKKPPLFTPTAFIGTGLKIGRMKRPFGSVEIRIPFVLSENSAFTSFATSSVGFEFLTTFYIPMGEQKLSYTYKNRKR